MPAVQQTGPHQRGIDGGLAQNELQILHQQILLLRKFPVPTPLQVPREKTASEHMHARLYYCTEQLSPPQQLIF